MESYDVIIAIVQGLVEGLTEFLPISSTGHLIVSGSLLGFNGDKAKVFNVVIQSGAICAVCWHYRHRLASVVGGVWHDASAQRFAGNILLAFMPAAVLGLLFSDYIKQFLFNPVTVALAFIGGGLLILWAENRQHTTTVSDMEAAGWKDALKVGCAQCLALIPGTSRSGATIIGALLCGFSRNAAAESSFFLAIPTIFAATLYDGWQNRALVGDGDLTMLAVGFVAAFASALVAVRGLLRFIASHTFRIFAWYRIAFGVVILATAYFGILEWR
ncbi:MAG: undecaprenyl-diphosphate phosphatase [Vicinamibacterales bacterium]